MRLIDADALLEKCNKDQTSLKFAVLTLILHHAPTIDAEPIVRCKDCENLEYEEREGKTIMFCNHFGDDISFHGMNENDFCSRGERREP